MLSAISTSALYGALRTNISNTQNQIAQDAAQISSQKISTDLAGYGSGAGTLTAMNTLSSRLSDYVNNAQALTTTLNVQDQALTSVVNAAQGARNAVATALGQGDGVAMMATLQTELATASSALNTQLNGQYLFSGGQSQTPPVTATSLSDLQSASVASVFQNGSLKTTSRLDDNTVVQTGVLASDAGTPLMSALQAMQQYDAGTPLMSALQAVQQYDAGPNGPFGSPLTSAQTSFLNGVLSQFDGAVTASTAVTAQNGVIAKQVSDASTRLSDQQTAIQGVVSNLTTPDEAQVANQLTLAQTTLQASAEVFQSLQNDSLLQVLQTG